MYAKIFRQMYRGTLATVGPWEALVTFQQLIVLADQEGVVDMTIDAIVRETTIPIEIIRKGIEALEKPDPESRTPAEDGRRILRLRENSTWGWQIVNYEHYRKLKREEDRRAYHQQYYHSTRKKKKVSTDSTRSQQFQPSQPIAEADAKTKTSQRATMSPLAEKPQESAGEKVEAKQALARLRERLA
jgi:hypothetical protein